ncbi:MAG: hypothetical protein K1X94_29725 [Sandaracinaceae bacterium]|nr:hypothetical protein [Sandaracinaceae bacterium]
MWAFLERWGGRLVLQGIAKGDPNETINAVDDAFGEARASILDVHFFSGVQVTFHFEVHTSSLETLAGGLARAGVVLDREGLEAMHEGASLDRTLYGSLAITLVHGDPDLRHEVPKVPG